MNAASKYKFPKLELNIHKSNEVNQLHTLVEQAFIDLIMDSRQMAAESGIMSPIPMARPNKEVLRKMEVLFEKIDNLIVQ